jgi:hypothetical protein
VPGLENQKECPAERRVEIGKQAVKDWNLLESIDQAKQDFNDVKEKLKAHVTFIDRASDSIAQYLDGVKSNLKQFADDWEYEILE